MQPPPAEPDYPYPPRFWWLKRITVVTAVVLLLLACVRVWWGWEASRRLQAEIDRIKAAGEPIEVADFTPVPVPDDQNAAPLLLKAIAMWDSTNESSGDDRAYLADNAEALALVREARSRPAADWGVVLATPMYATFPPALGQCRQLANRLDDVARRQARLGAHTAAVETVRDILALAQRRNRGVPTLIGHLVAVSIEALGVRTLEAVYPMLILDEQAYSGPLSVAPATRLQVEDLIGELLNEQPWDESLEDSLFIERAMLQDAARAIVDGQLSLSFLNTMNMAPKPSSWERGSSLGVLAWSAMNVAPKPSSWERGFILLLKPAFELDAVRMMTFDSAVIHASRRPTWPEAEAMFPPAPEKRSLKARLSRPFITRMSFNLPLNVRTYFQLLALRRCAAIALAFRLYELDHGSRPEELDQVVPQYLPSMAEDPFHRERKWLRYLESGALGRPVVYSLGIDGKDQKGANRQSGSEGDDLPFYLDGDRHVGASVPDPGSTEAGEHQPDEPDHQRNPDEDQGGQDGPGQGQSDGKAQEPQA